jgi:peptide/nickel transport system permease protein
VLAYILRRLLQSIVVILGVTFVTFALMYLSGDPVAVLAGDQASRSEIEVLRRELGFDRPWLVQYLAFLQGAVQGDLGTSLRYRQPVLPLILERVPATATLAAAAMIIAVGLALPLGVTAAVMRGKWADTAAILLALAGQSLPGFWLGIMLIYIFGVKLRLVPISGMGTLAHLILPAVTLSAYSLARNSRLIRSTMLDALNQDYVRTARAKGLHPAVVIRRHALRNSLLSFTTIVGLELGFLLGGAVITEMVFAWPGLGRLTVQAIYGKDVYLVQGAVMLMAIVFVMVNLVVDLAYAVLDPRVQYR